METELERLHRTTLDMLLRFDKVCRENSLTYFLDSGTALGAVRHQGFIPWDDDIDVGMPRKDYERFLEIGQGLLPENLFLQTSGTDPSYRRFAAKIRLEGTRFPESGDSGGEHEGIFIDIFPFDNVPSNPVRARVMVSVSRFLFWIIRSSRTASPSPSCVYRAFQAVARKLPQGWIDNLSTCYEKFCRRYEKVETGRMTSFFWRMTQNRTYLFDTSRMLPTRDILFEGRTVRIMNDPDYYLREMYGDYMVLPSEDKRIYHCKGQIDFGKYL